MQTVGILQARYVDAIYQEHISILHAISPLSDHTILFADATAQSGAALGQGTGPISLTNIGCTGNESRLADCSSDTNTAGCTHSNDASATCVTQCK